MYSLMLGSLGVLACCLSNAWLHESYVSGWNSAMLRVLFSTCHMNACFFKSGKTYFISLSHRLDWGMKKVRRRSMMIELKTQEWKGKTICTVLLRSWWNHQNAISIKLRRSLLWASLHLKVEFLRTHLPWIPSQELRSSQEENWPLALGWETA